MFMATSKCFSRDKVTPSNPSAERIYLLSLCLFAAPLPLEQASLSSLSNVDFVARITLHDNERTKT